MGVRAGATMCELYELAGWEGGADELSGSGWSFLAELVERIGMELCSICIGLAQLVLKIGWLFER